MLSSILGLSILYAWEHRGSQGLAVPKPLNEDSDSGIPVAVSKEDDIEVGVAGQYVRAFQENNCEELIRLTWWMNERLRYAADQGEDASRAREELCANVLHRKVEEGQITAEGVRDKYIFTPGAKVTPISRDQGLEDLAKPTAYRVWYAVEYTDASRALLGEDGRAVQRLHVGINVSQDGYVLKSDVLGTAELNRELIAYWPEDSGRN